MLDIDETIYEVVTLTRATPEGNQSVLMFREYGALLNGKLMFRGRGTVRLKVPTFVNPQGYIDQGTEFHINAKDPEEAFGKFQACLATAGEEMQADADKQIAQMKLKAGLNGRMLPN